jgi:hypothetical protein
MIKHTSAALTAALLIGTAALSGCATSAGDLTATPSTTAPSANGPFSPAPWIDVPPVSVGQWYNLGIYQAPWLASDETDPVAASNVPTRVAGWLRENDPKDRTKGYKWLAIVIAQIMPGAYVPCSAQASRLEDVLDTPAGCLRLRRDTDFNHWLQTTQPTLYRWADERGWTRQPRAWVAYRLPSANGGTVEVHALFAPYLIEPPTRNATGAIDRDQPGQQWTQRLAAAVRDGVDEGPTKDGAITIHVPPFPFVPGSRATLPPPPPAAIPATDEGSGWLDWLTQWEWPSAPAMAE